MIEEGEVVAGGISDRFEGVDADEEFSDGGVPPGVEIEGVDGGGVAGVGGFGMVLRGGRGKDLDQKGRRLAYTQRQSECSVVK